MLWPVSAWWLAVKQDMAVQEDSPDLARYMQLSQREASADVVNASILIASSAEKRPAKSQDPRPPPPQVIFP